MSDYSSTYPTQSPTFAFDAKAGKLDSRLSYTRSSSGTYMSNEKALSSENLLLQSQDFDTSWTATHMSAPTGSQTAPDGTSTAWLLSAASGTGAPTIYQNASPRVSSSTSYTLVCHVKAGTASHAYISFRGAPAESAYAVIDFASPLSPTSGGAVMTGISSSSVALGNSWYRLTLTFTTATITSGYSFIYVGTSDGTSPTSGGYVNYDSTGDTIYAWGAQISSTNSKVYDSPTTTQISREYAPLLKEASADAPRFEFAADGQSDAGSPLGLLIESSASNLLPYGHNGYNSSNNFSMTLVDLIASQNAAVSPSGLLDATLLTDTGGLTQHRFDTGISGLDSSKKYTLSGYFKATGTTTSMSLRISSGNTYGAEFNFSTGYVGTYGAAPESYTFAPVGNGWIRVSITARLVGGSTASLRINTNLGDVQSDDYSGMLIYGLQFEEGSSPSSVLLTSGSALTRASDSCSVDLSATNYSGGEGSLVVDLSINGRTSGIGAVISDGSTENYYQVGQFASSLTYILYSELNNSVQANITQAETSIGAKKLAASWATNDVSACIDGGAVTTDTSNAFPLLTDLDIGSNPTGAAVLNGHVKRLSLFNVTLSDVELQSLTTI